MLAVILNDIAAGMIAVLLSSFVGDVDEARTSLCRQCSIQTVMPGSRSAGCASGSMRIRNVLRS
jgi:hypothetical protein